LLILLLSSITLVPPGAGLLRVGPVGITLQSILGALALALRVNAMAFGFMLLLWTTEQGELVAGLTRLGLSYEASLTIAVAMQFVPTFGRIAGEILEAQQARGLVVPRRNPLAIARAYLPVLVPLLITALRTADNLSLALIARGYRAGAPRSSRRQLRLRRADWLLMLAGVAAAGAALWSRLA